MKNVRFVFLLWIVALFSGAAFAEATLPQSTEDRQATEAYRSGDLSTARILWQEELEAQRESSDDNQRARICYNLGNLALRQNRALDAVGWYSASLRLRPRDEDTWSNLELARLNAGLEAADRGDLKSTLDRLLTSWTEPESSWIAWLGWLPLALALAFEALRGGRGARWLAFGALLCGLLCSAPWSWHRLQAGADPVMVVATDNASARSEPRSNAARVLELKAGQILSRSDQTPGWVEVEHEDGRRGWLRSEHTFALNR